MPQEKMPFAGFSIQRYYFLDHLYQKRFFRIVFFRTPSFRQKITPQLFAPGGVYVSDVFKAVLLCEGVLMQG